MIHEILLSSAFLFWFAPPIIAVVLLAALFLPKFGLGVLRAPPTESLSYLAYELRLARYRVVEEPRRLSVRIGPFAVAKVWARPGDDGSEIAFQADATPGGWVAILILVLALVPFGTFLAMALILYMFLRARQFVRDRLLTLIPADGAVPTLAPPDELRRALVTGLAEAHRLAVEAYEVERSAYHDVLLVIAAAALALWAFLLVLLVLLPPNPDFGRNLSNALIAATLVAVPAGALSSLLARRLYRPRLARYRVWADRLHGDLAREGGRLAPEPERSSFQILMEAAREVPSWIDVRRRKGYARYPWNEMVAFVAGYWGFWLAWIGVWIFGAQNVILSALFFSVGVGLVVFAFAFHQRWKRRFETEAQEELALWRRRYEDLRGRMEQFLEDL